eukprot:1501302-Rhodomonas_salina.4
MAGADVSSSTSSHSKLLSASDTRSEVSRTANLRPVQGCTPAPKPRNSPFDRSSRPLVSKRCGSNSRGSAKSKGSRWASKTGMQTMHPVVAAWSGSV